MSYRLPCGFASTNCMVLLHHMVKTHDSVGRRLRTVSISTGKYVQVTQNDVMVLERLHRHGQLSSEYICRYFHLLGGLRKDYGKDRLTLLSKEDNNCQGGRLVHKPDWQYNTYRSDHNKEIYDLTPFAENLLKNEGRWSKYALPTLVRSTSFPHDYMATAILASIELATLQTENVRFIFGDEILERAGKDTMVFPVSDGCVRPDGLFGLEYTVGDQKFYRFFLLEADRNTETLHGNKTKKSYENKIQQYRDFVVGKKYKDALGITAGIQVLHVTTNVSRVETMLELTAKHNNGQCNYMLFTHASHFNAIFKPSPIMTELFTSPWKRAGAPDFRIDMAHQT